MTQRFSIQPLQKQDRSRFDCGNEILNRYFQRQVGQDIRRDLTRCFIATDILTSAIAGFYTLSGAEIKLSRLPAELTRKLPPYDSIPAARIGRLAIDQQFQGLRLGGAMLNDAFRRVKQGDIAAMVIIVDAKDGYAAEYYRRFGFQAFHDSTLSLFAVLKSLTP